jgi:membrane-bound metal-dependent hydrolase YbcI (DUF457 family)
MLFWHIGGTIALIRYAFRDERMDLRFLLVGGIVADVVDTPIGLVGYERLAAVRLGTHSLLVASLVMVAVVLATRRGRPRRRWMALAVGMLAHLVLDAMWADQETLLWPFLGWEFTPAGPVDVGAYLRAILTDPVMWAGELVGLAYLVWLWQRAGLSSAATRATFWSTGKVDVPIRS